MSKYANSLGFLSILMWSLLGVLPIIAGNVPSLLLLALALFFGSPVFIIYWKIKHGSIINAIKKADKKYYLYTWILIFFTEISLIVSMKSGDPIAAYVSLNSWPMILMVLSALILKTKLKAHHYIGIILGFTGIIMLAFSDYNQQSTSLADTIYAIFFGITNAFLWSCYSIMNRKFENVPSEMVGLPLMMCCISALILHLVFEPRYELYDMEIQQLIAIMVMGILPWGIAYITWNYATKFGDINTLSNLGYLMPIIGTIFIILAGFEKSINILSIGAFLTIFAGIIISSR